MEIVPSGFSVTDMIGNDRKNPQKAALATPFAKYSAL
jgi:hypothetical protein